MIEDSKQHRNNKNIRITSVGKDIRKYLKLIDEQERSGKIFIKNIENLRNLNQFDDKTTDKSEILLLRFLLGIFFQSQIYLICYFDSEKVFWD